MISGNSFVSQIKWGKSFHTHHILIFYLILQIVWLISGMISDLAVILINYPVKILRLLVVNLFNDIKHEINKTDCSTCFMSIYVELYRKWRNYLIFRREDGRGIWSLKAEFRWRSRLCSRQKLFVYNVVIFWFCSL